MIRPKAVDSIRPLTLNSSVTKGLGCGADRLLVNAVSNSVALEGDAT
jgi:hypothetical protein